MNLNFDGAIPFCPIPTAEAWDEVTFFGNVASGNSEKYVPVRGRGTPYPTGPLSLEDVCRIYWGMDKSRLKFTGGNFNLGPDAPTDGQRIWSWDYDEEVIDYRLNIDTRVCGPGWQERPKQFYSPSGPPSLEDHTNFLAFPQSLADPETVPFPNNSELSLFYGTSVPMINLTIPQVVKDGDGNYYPYFRIYVPWGVLSWFANTDPPFSEGDPEWLGSWYVNYLDSLRNPNPGYDDPTILEFPTKLRFFEDDIKNEEFGGIQLWSAWPNQAVYPDIGSPWPSFTDISLERFPD